MQENPVDLEYTPIADQIKAMQTMSASGGSKLASAVWKYLGALVADRKDGKIAISLGRIAFVVWYAQATWVWTDWSPAEDLPAGMLTIGIALLAYVTGSKIVEAVKG